jgi:bacillithiol biosynthesis cysteine-adding enzyme BshC
MQPSCVRQDQIPGTSTFFADYLYRFDKVSGFFPYSSWQVENVASAATSLAFPADRRAQIVAALAAQNDNPTALRKLARPDTVAVITGQQVGFLLGPAYTIFKALTAVRLAQQLNEQGISAVPIFWLATEDHDLAEVDHAWVFNPEASATKVSLAGSIVNGGPVGDVILNEIPLAELRAALGDLPFADEVMRQVADSYQPGATLGSAFRKLLEQVLKGMGLLYLDPLAAPIREAAAPLLADAVERVPELLAALRARNSEIAIAGYHTQVHIDADTSLFFLLKNGRRLPIRWKDGRFSSRDGHYSAAELAAMANQLSPNALLRPVMQDYLLPTASYIAGPSEAAYFAQSAVLYEKLLGRMPVIYPRNSFTLLDARASKLLTHYGLRVTDLLDHRENVKGTLAARLVPPALGDQIKATQASVSHALSQLQRSLLDFDPTLAAAASKGTAKVTYQFAKLERKIARETMRRDERATKDADYLLNLVYPQRHLQERFYSILPFLAKHGLDLPQQLLEQVQLSCPDHMLRTF